MIDAVRFSSAFVGMTRRKLDAPSETPTLGPADSASLSNAVPAGVDPKILARQAYVALTALIPAAAGSSPVALAVAAEVGRALGGEAVERATSRLVAAAGPAEPALVSAQPRLQAVFDKVAAVSGAPAELALWGRKSEAQALGDRVFAGKPILAYADSEPCLGFIFAHEVAHVERRDSLGMTGVSSLQELVEADVGGDQWNLAEKSYSHAVELAADRRAAEVCVKLGYDPLPILRMVIHADHDADHPAGLKRAQAIREVYAQHGVKVSPADWRGLKG